MTSLLVIFSFSFRISLVLFFAVGCLLPLSVDCSSKDQHSLSHPHVGLSSTHRALFGIRGGGFFGFGNRSRGGGGDGGDGPPNEGKYPALSRDEIEEKLNIPIFGITDNNGNGVILSDGSNSIFHFFFSKGMADMALQAVTAANSEAPELKVTAFHLGKCWFKLIGSSGTKMFKLQKHGGDSQGEEVTKPIHFRLVPSFKDLMGARILTGLKPNDVEELKNAVETPDTEKALSIIQKAGSESTNFKDPFDQIPVFAIAQMRVRKRDEDGNPVGEYKVPMHLSSKTMTETWTQFINNSPQFQNAEATLQLVELHKMIEMMQTPSDFNFRNVVFITPSYGEDDKNGESDDDDSDDDDNDGGGGDNGMTSSPIDNDQSSSEPFVASIEVFTDMSNPSPSLVPFY